jgi:glutamine amidotransferase
VCRHAAYWGPARPLAGVALEAPHSLLVQCEAAREMPWGCDNLDGWGFAWHESTGEGRRYRSALPMTEDVSGQELLRAVSSGRFLVHVRQKTPGAATHPTGSAPFWDGAATFFAHNGFVPGFHDGVADLLRSRLSPERAAMVEGDADSEVLFALVLDRLAAGEPPDEAVGVLAELEHELGGRYNVLLMTPDALVATRCGTTLYVHRGGGVTVSSEPLDDQAWTPVPDRTVLTVDDGGVREERW